MDVGFDHLRQVSILSGHGHGDDQLQ
jgi:hypothetical protein